MSQIAKLAPHPLSPITLAAILVAALLLSRLLNIEVLGRDEGDYWIETLAVSTGATIQVVLSQVLARADRRVRRRRDV